MKAYSLHIAMSYGITFILLIVNVLYAIRERRKITALCDGEPH